MKTLMTVTAIAAVAFWGLACDNDNGKFRYRDSDNHYKYNDSYKHSDGYVTPPPPPVARGGDFRGYWREGFEPRTIEREGWILLGSQTVDFKKEGDHIIVRRGERFSQLRLVVVGAPIEVYTMNVYFRDGEKYSPIGRYYFREGSRTGPIDLPGRSRDIKTVTFSYRTAGPRAEGRATVYVFAR